MPPFTPGMAGLLLPGTAASVFVVAAGCGDPFEPPEAELDWGVRDEATGSSLRFSLKRLGAENFEGSFSELTTTGIIAGAEIGRVEAWVN